MCSAFPYQGIHNKYTRTGSLLEQTKYMRSSKELLCIIYDIVCHRQSQISQLSIFTVKATV